MARGKKTGGKDFGPGNPGGPGRPPLPPELREAKRLTKTAFEALVNKYLWANEAVITAALQSPETPAVERMVINIICAGNDTGSPGQLEFFLQRLLGKVKDQVEVSTPKPFVVTKGDGTQVVMGAKVEKEEGE